MTRHEFPSRRVRAGVGRFPRFFAGRGTGCWPGRARGTPAGLLALTLSLAACGGKEAAVMPGTVEWDRVAVLAETAEPVLEIRVKEGDVVKAGDVLLLLDTRRGDAQLAAATAERDAARAQLAALRNGARRETIDAARGDAARLQAQADNAVRERDRVRKLFETGLLSQADLERAETAAQAATAAAQSTDARLRELRHGSRDEDIEAARARLAALDAKVQALAVNRERLAVTAPRAGRVDALPFRVGDQPVAGATLVSLLAGDAPYARIYVPAALRASVAAGAAFQVSVEGVPTPLAASLRSIRSEPAFTPYYALVGDDASRLVYRAELALAGDAARALPAGLPASATLLPAAAPHGTAAP